MFLLEASSLAAIGWQTSLASSAATCEFRRVRESVRYTSAQVQVAEQLN